MGTLYVKKLNAQFPVQCDPEKGRPPLTFYLVASYLHRASRYSSCDCVLLGRDIPPFFSPPTARHPSGLLHQTGRSFADWGFFFFFFQAVFSLLDDS